MFNDDDYSAALPIGIVLVAATVLLCACVGCHETALRAWKLCLGQRPENNTGSLQSIAPPRLAAGSDASAHALEMAEVPKIPQAVTGDEERGLREGFPEVNDKTSNLLMNSSATAPGAADGSSLSGLPPVPEAMLEAVVADEEGVVVGISKHPGVKPTTGDSFDLWAGLSPDQRGLMSGLSGDIQTQPGGSNAAPGANGIEVTPLQLPALGGAIGKESGHGEGSGSEASDGKLADSLAVHQAVLRQLRRARFEIDPSRYREDREYRAGVKTLKEAVERFGFARVHTALHRSGPEANIKSSSPRASPRKSKSTKQPLASPEDPTLEGLPLQLSTPPLIQPQPELPHLSRSAQPLGSGLERGNGVDKDHDGNHTEEMDGAFGMARVGGGWRYSDSSDDAHFGWGELQGVEVELAQVRPLDALSAMIYCGPPFQMHWTLRGHAVFPTALRKAVATCLLMQYRQANAASADLVSRGMKAESSGGDAPNAAANDADVSNTIPVNSRKGYSSTVVLPPALWFCIFEYFGFNYSMPYRAIGSDGSYDASSMSDAAPNLVGSDAAPLGSGGFRLSNVDEEGAEDCDDAVEQEVNYGDKVLAFFSSAAARAAPLPSDMPPLSKQSDTNSGAFRESSSSMNFHLSGKSGAISSQAHLHLSLHSSPAPPAAVLRALEEGQKRVELNSGGGGVGSSFSSSTEGNSGGGVDVWSDEARWRSLVVLWGGLAKRCLKASDKNSRALGERLLVSLHCHTLQAGRAPIPLLESSRGDDERLEWLYCAPCACDRCHKAATASGANATAIGAGTSSSGAKPTANTAMANKVAPMMQSNLSTASANTDASATSSAATSGGGLSSAANGLLSTGQSRCLDLRAVLASWSVKKRTQSYRSASPMSSASSGTHSSYHPLGRYSPHLGSSLAGPWAHALGGGGGSGLQGLSQRSNTDAPKLQTSTSNTASPRAPQLAHLPASSEGVQATAFTAAPFSMGLAPTTKGATSEILPPQAPTSPKGQLPDSTSREPPKPPRTAYL